MQTVNEDKRCYWFNPEYAEVMTHIKRDGSTAGMISRDSWDDTPLQRAVVDNNECYVASRTHIVSAGHITPREFIDELRPRDLYNGHCNRHEYYYTERRKVIDEEGWTEEQQETINSECQRLIDACATAIRDAMSWLDSMRPTDSTDGVEFRLDADARLEMQVFNKYYNDLLETSPLAHIFSRAIPIIKRNALVEAVLDRSTKITAKHVRAAIAEWHYGRESAEFIFASTTLSDEERIRRELVRTIESHGGRISARDLAKTSRKYRGAGVAHATLEALIKQRLGKWDVTKTPTKDRCEFVLFVNSENQP